MKKLLCAILTVSFCLSTFANAVIMQEVYPVEEKIGSENYNENAQLEPTVKELEKIIKIVKPKLDVPEECTEFNWDYSSPTYYSTSSWSLEWYSTDRTKSVSVTCDDEGLISYYSTYTYDKNKSYSSISLPNYTKKELEKTADATLKKLVPHAADSMKLVSSKANSIYSKSFTYNYARYENGYIVPDDTARVIVDYVTGKPTSLSVSYNKYVTFDNELKTSPDEAKKLLSEKQKMVLSYRLKTEYDDDGNRIGRKAYLVYTPEISYISVDANTGKLYTERNTWTINDRAPADLMFAKENSVMLSDTAADDGGYRLTEQELEQLEVLDNLITREAAIKAVTENKYLYIDPEATAVDAQLRQSYDYDYYYYARPVNDADKSKNNYQWEIRLTAPYKASKDNAYYVPNIYATIDAKTGNVISFSATLPGYSYYETTNTTNEIPELKYTEENAKDIFTEFATTVVPDYVKNSRFSSTGSRNVHNYIETTDGKSTPIYRGTSVTLTRVNEGVDFNYNTINGAVDRVTGKIISFSYNWYTDVVFESPKDAISPEKAYEVLLNSEGFGLNYEINSDFTYNKYLEEVKDELIDYNKLYTTKQYTRLVYSGYNYPSTTVSAITGDIIDYNGKKIVPQKETVYTDISGHWAEEDIIMLTDMGFTFEGTEFKPDSYTSAEEFSQIMSFFGKYTLANNDNKTATEKAKFTRTDAVKKIISAAGYSKIAAMPDIFITDFADNSELLREDVGFIAIARGFGLVQGDLGSFRPYDNMTRAEALRLIINYIKMAV